MKTQNYLLLIIFTFIVLTGCLKEDGGIDSSDIASYEGTYNENYKEYDENPFVKVADQPISTFSVDADGASYANMRRFLYYGQTPPKASVRIEEFINYFTFNYAEPLGNENVSINSEIASCPWAQDHFLVRLGMKGKNIPENELPNSNYIFLIDVSGSMNSPEKLGILKSGFKLMVDNLDVNDKVAIVTYAGQAGVLLPSTSGDNKDEIKTAIDKLGAGGATAGADGIITAYEIAEENYIKNGNNRVILGSDGDFNVGPSSVDELIKLIEEKRKTGIYLTTLGVGSGNLNDYMMEQIANKGNGNYEYIDNANQLQKVFVHEKSKFITVATDSKIQVTFNPNMVASYRLIGYENRSLNTEDFENDSTDAGEIGADQTITAIYEVILAKNDGSERFLNFDFRYKRSGSSESQLLQNELKTVAGNINSASENIRFATAVVGFGLILRNSEYKGTVSKQMVLDISSNATTYDPHEYRKEFVEIVRAWTK